MTEEELKKMSSQSLRALASKMESQENSFKQIKDEVMNKKLRDMPANYGFKTLKDLIKALEQAHANTQEGSAGPGRPRIDETKREKISDMLRSREYSTAEIAEKTNVSEGSVSLIKKTMGLTKTRRGTLVAA